MVEHDEEYREDRDAEADSRQLAGLAGNSDWHKAKKVLVSKIGELTSILDMDEALLGDPIELKARKHAADLLCTWMLEIDGEKLLHDRIETVEEDKVDPDTGLLRVG